VSLPTLPHIRNAHSGHVTHPHDHDWQVRVWGYVRKGCTGHWYCQTCRDWFVSEPCATGTAREAELTYVRWVIPA